MFKSQENCAGPVTHFHPLPLGPPLVVLGFGPEAAVAPLLAADGREVQLVGGGQVDPVTSSTLRHVREVLCGYHTGEPGGDGKKECCRCTSCRNKVLSIAIDLQQAFGSDYVPVLCYSVSFTLTLWMVALERLHACHTSPLLFAYWTAITLCSLPSLRADIDEYLDSSLSRVQLGASLVFYPCVWLQWMLQWVADRPPLQEAPEDTASVGKNCFRDSMSF